MQNNILPIHSCRNILSNVFFSPSIQNLLDNSFHFVWSWHRHPSCRHDYVAHYIHSLVHDLNLKQYGDWLPACRFIAAAGPINVCPVPSPASCMLRIEVVGPRTYRPWVTALLAFFNSAAQLGSIDPGSLDSYCSCPCISTTTPTPYRSCILHSNHEVTTTIPLHPSEGGFITQPLLAPVSPLQVKVGLSHQPCHFWHPPFHSIPSVFHLHLRLK